MDPLHNNQGTEFPTLKESPTFLPVIWVAKALKAKAIQSKEKRC